MSRETQDSPELHRSLGRIEGKLDSLGSTFIQHIQDDKANFTEMRLQINSIWKKICTYGGIGMGLAIFAPHLIKKLIG